MSSQMTRPAHPLHEQAWVDMCNNLYPSGYKQHFYRRQGKSTAQALSALAWCINNPYMPLKIHDHYGTIESNQYLKRLLQTTIDKLGLEHFVFGNDGKNLTIQFGERE